MNTSGNLFCSMGWGVWSRLGVLEQLRVVIAWVLHGIQILLRERNLVTDLQRPAIIIAKHMSSMTADCLTLLLKSHRSQTPEYYKLLINRIQFD